MYRTLMKTKLHRAIVTEAKLNYVGSITIDEELMELGDIMQDEKVQIVNINNGARWETYAIKGPRHSGVICLNGGGARLAQPGDIVIIMTYATMTDDEARQFHPKILFLDANNKVVINGLDEMHATDMDTIYKKLGINNVRSDS